MAYPAHGRYVPTVKVPSPLEVHTWTKSRPLTAWTISARPSPLKSPESHNPFGTAYPAHGANVLTAKAPPQALSIAPAMMIRATSRSAGAYRTVWLVCGNAVVDGSQVRCIMTSCARVTAVAHRPVMAE